MKWGLTKDVLNEIWTGCIEQILLHGCPAWIQLLKNKRVVRKIESVQRLVAIKMIRGFKTISYEAALTLSGLPRVVGRIHERILSYAAKHQDHYSEHIPNILTLNIL